MRVNKSWMVVAATFSLTFGVGSVASAYTKEISIDVENAVVDQGTSQTATLVVTLSDQGKPVTTRVGSTNVPHIDASRIGVPATMQRPAGQCAAFSSRAVEDPSYYGVYRFTITLAPGNPAGCTAAWKRGKTVYELNVWDPNGTGYVGQVVAAVEAR